ncbi:MAG TPA: hypothetical protein VGP07_03850 [Polyangia bacterium]|jgi:hypothetical protein
MFGFLLAALALVFPGLTSGCCDCGGAFNQFGVSAHVPIAALSITGDGCEPPTCQGGEMMSGGCTTFLIKLTAAGTCHLVATAVDGRQVSLDVPIQRTGDNCCGPQFRTDADTSDIFAAPDAGTD